MFFEALDRYRDRRSSFAIAYGYSLIAQVLFISIFYLLAKSLHIELALGTFYLIVPLITISAMVPSIGGLGVREASIVYLFKAYIPMEQAVALSLLVALFIYGIGAVCGILYAVRGGGILGELQKMEDSVETNSVI